MAVLKQKGTWSRPTRANHHHTCSKQFFLGDEMTVMRFFVMASAAQCENLGVMWDEPLSLMMYPDAHPMSSSWSDPRLCPTSCAKVMALSARLAEIWE